MLIKNLVCKKLLHWWTFTFVNSAKHDSTLKVYWASSLVGDKISA